MARGSKLFLLFDLVGEERNVFLEFLFGLDDTSFAGGSGSTTSWLDVFEGFEVLFCLGDVFDERLAWWIWELSALGFEGGSLVGLDVGAAGVVVSPAC